MLHFCDCGFTVIFGSHDHLQVIGAPLAVGLLALNNVGGLAGWRWLFLLEGLPSILLGVAFW